ncbi:MAG: MarR family winged helix-turn-helix transcriptional regulator [Vitreoscilla sp.]
MSSNNDPFERADFYSADGYAQQESVGAAMKGVMASITYQVDRRLVEHDLTHAQWVPLFKLAHGECQTVAELARTLQSDPGAMTRALDRLEAKGLVARVRSSEDRRVVNLELTDAGREVAAVVPAVLAEVLNLHLAGFSKEEWRALLSMLKRMRANGDALRAAAANNSATPD